MSSTAKNIIFRQLFESNSFTYTYILGCFNSKKAVIIDPVIEMIDRDANLLKELKLDLVYGLNTHVHADHVTGTGELKKVWPRMKSILGKNSGGQADIYAAHGSVIEVGDMKLQVRSTPGHTDGCVTFVNHQKQCAFTGDAILIRGCGRTDFQQGSPERLYSSIHEQIFSLPDNYLLYPAHDYNGQSVTSVGEEKLFNPRLTKPLDEFVKIMKTLNLPYPHQIDKSVPANIVCGIYELMDEKLAKKIRAN